MQTTIPIHNKYQWSLKSPQNSTICEESSVFVDEDTNSEIDQQVIASTSTTKIQQPTPTISKYKTCVTTQTWTIKKLKLQKKKKITNKCKKKKKFHFKKILFKKKITQRL